MRDRHAAHYMATLRQQALQLQGSHQQAALMEMDVESDNGWAAWSWTVKHGQVERLAEAMEGLGVFCDWRAHYQEGEKAFRMVAEKLVADELVADKFVVEDSSQPVEQLKLWASGLAWQARFNQRLGQVEAAREQARQGLAVLEELTLEGQDVRRQRALALQVIGEIELQLGNCQNGKEPLSQSLSLYQTLDDRRSTASCLRSLGRLFERMGDYARAAQLHQESVAICRALGAQRDTIDALLDLFVDLQCMGRRQEAERLLWESLAIARQLQDRAAITAVRYRLALILMDSKAAESLILLKECVAVYTEMGDRHRSALALMRVGDAHMHLGQYDQARATLEESLAWYREVDNRWGIGAALRLLAGVAQIEGKSREAWQFSQESLTAFRRSGAQADAGWAITSLAMAALELDDLGQARQNLVEALRVAVKFRHDSAPMYVLVALALLAAKEGKGERAVELWKLASRVSVIVTSRFYQDLYRQRIAPIVEALPADVVAAAEARGRSRDIWAALEESSAEMGGSSHAAGPF